MENHPEKDFSPIKQKLNQVMDQINSNRDKEPKIYKIKDYDDEHLTRFDRLNYGNKLLLASPTTVYSLKYNCLEYRQISEIIDALGLATQTGENFLIQSTRKIGYNSIPKIIESLNMFRQQVVRQSKLSDEEYFNIFDKNKMEKANIVWLKYNDIIDYIIKNAKELVWGELTTPQKKLYLSSAFNSTKVDNQIKDAMIKSIANYTTLPELEELKKDDYKVLNRFIKR